MHGLNILEARTSLDLVSKWTSPIVGKFFRFPLTKEAMRNLNLSSRSGCRSLVKCHKASSSNAN